MSAHISNAQPNSDPTRFRLVEPMRLDWTRLLPDEAHRWRMASRPSDAREFFRQQDASGAVLRERSLWLKGAPEDYAALTFDGRELLRESADFAAAWAQWPERNETADDTALLHGLGRVWEPDFVLLRPNAAGIFRVVGGAVCFPSSWSLPEKMGLPIDSVHGPVPGLNKILGRQINTFLSRIEPGAAWARENWGLAADNSLNHHPRRPLRRLNATASPDRTWVRLEQQLLFRLPQTLGLVFGIRVSVHPMLEVVADPAARQGMIRALDSMEPEAARYKGLATARKPLIQALRKLPAR